jgi:hypothetical protein
VAGRNGSECSPTLPELGSGGDSRRRFTRRRRGRRDGVASKFREHRGKLGEDGLETHAADMSDDMAEFSPPGSSVQGSRAKPCQSPAGSGRFTPPLGKLGRTSGNNGGSCVEGSVVRLTLAGNLVGWRSTCARRGQMPIGGSSVDGGARS